jgi:predicted double-glycine peptidase
MQFYKQTTNYTCAASSLLMILNHFRPLFRLSRKNEFEIWQKSVILPVRASSIYGLAIYAHEQGVGLKVITEKLEYDFPDYRFKGYTKEDIDNAQYMSELYLKKLKKMNVPIAEKRFTLKDIKKLLYDGKILMIRLDAGVFRETGRTSNYVVIAGIKNNYFIVYDPAQGKLYISEEKFKEAFEDLSERRKRLHKMIVFG